MNVEIETGGLGDMETRHLSFTPSPRHLIRLSLIIFGLALLFPGPAHAEKAAVDEASPTSTTKGEQSPQIEVMDIPTADILDPLTYATAFRFYNEGGLMSRLVIGPLKRVNLGISFDGQRV